MPIYEYQCKDCDTTFEKYLRSMFSQETITCPSCGGEHVAKALSLIGATNRSTSAGSAPACGPVG